MWSFDSELERLVLKAIQNGYSEADVIADLKAAIENVPDIAADAPKPDPDEAQAPEA